MISVLSEISTGSAEVYSTYIRLLGSPCVSLEAEARDKVRVFKVVNVRPRAMG